MLQLFIQIYMDYGSYLRMECEFVVDYDVVECI